MKRVEPRGPRLFRAWWPRSLRRQFGLALSALALLIVASNLSAVFALHLSARTTRQLAEERVVRLQDAQELVAGTLLIEREARGMATAATTDELRERHTRIIQQLHALDELVRHFGEASGDLSVLTLHQWDQLFRNATHVLAGLRENVLVAEAAFDRSVRAHAAHLQTSPSEMLLLHRLRGANDHNEIEDLRQQFVRQAGASRLVDEDPFAARARLIQQREALQRFTEQLEGSSTGMVAAAQELSTRFTADFREAVEQLAETSTRTERSVVLLLLVSLLSAWLVSRFFLGHVLGRLQQVSHHLRREGAEGPASRVPVQGGDEIGEMARAVESFVEDRRRLYLANRDLERFSYSVAHDLRAPLRAIRGFADLLLQSEEARLEPEVCRHLRIIHENVRRMGALIDDILSLSRLTRVEVTRGSVDMVALVREAYAEATTAAPGRNIVLRLDELPVAAGDRALLRQVLLNLLCNSIKFTAPRSEAVIEVDGGVEGNECHYRLKDNGVGFDMRYAGKLFEAFERLHGMGEFEGTGIGLAIVKRIVELHGGRVWAEGKVGEGATFHFTLPCAAERDVT